MRVPIPVVLLLCLLVVGGVWWSGTRQLDFLTSPSADQLAVLRARMDASVPVPDQPENAVSAPPVAEQTTASPIDHHDDSALPQLDEYRELAAGGARQMIETAVVNESRGDSQRALLAWERVLDSTRPDLSQTAGAIAAIAKLRAELPEWNPDPAQTAEIALHAGTTAKTAQALEPVLAQIAGELQQASSGLLKVTAKLSSGNDTGEAPDPAPVALWLAGATTGSASTDVFSFTVATPDETADTIRRTAFLLIRNYLSRASKLTPPPALDDGPAEPGFLTHRTTRLTWQTLGRHLNAGADE